MAQGQEQDLAPRAPFDSMLTHARTRSSQRADVVPQQPENRAWYGSLAHLIAARGGIRPLDRHVQFKRAVAEELAFGHAFLFVPVFVGSGVLVWFWLPQTPGPLKLALLMCVFGMAFFALRHRPGFWRTGILIAALVTAGMALAAWETARLGTVVLDTPVTTWVRGTVTARGNHRSRILAIYSGTCEDVGPGIATSAHEDHALVPQPGNTGQHWRRYRGQGAFVAAFGCGPSGPQQFRL